MCRVGCGGPGGTAVKRRYKCWNCLDDRQMPGREFEAVLPVCPTCTLDGRTPDGKGVLLEIPFFHFAPPHPVLKGKGTGKRACDGKPTGTDRQPCTGEPSVVTCPACLKTDAYREEAEKAGVPVAVAERDFRIESPPDEPATPPETPPTA